jgi:hypothetical protein
VQYSSYRQIPHEWVPLSDLSPELSEMFASVSVASVSRIVDSRSLQDDDKLGVFRIYRIKLQPSIIELVNADLMDFAESTMVTHKEGLQVSNAG